MYFVEDQLSLYYYSVGGDVVNRYQNINQKKIHDVTRQTSPLVEVLVQRTDSVSLLLQHFPENIFLSLETEIIIFDI